MSRARRLLVAALQPRLNLFDLAAIFPIAWVAQEAHDRYGAAGGLLTMIALAIVWGPISRAIERRAQP